MTPHVLSLEEVTLSSEWTGCSTNEKLQKGFLSANWIAAKMRREVEIAENGEGDELDK